MDLVYNWLDSNEAKSQYFLTPDDLRSLNVQSAGGGIGCGRPTNFYNPVELQAAAIRKHGEAGFKAKKEARMKRESKKRAREEAADDALEALQTAAPPPPAAAAAAAAGPETTALRKSLLKLAKKVLGFTEGGGPKNWRVEVPAVRAATFAALAGRPADSTLRTFVKAGAYHSHDVDATALFAVRDSSELLRVFKREGVGIQIDDRVTLKYKPSDMTLSLHGGGEIVCDERTM